MKSKKITTAEVASCKVASLPTRPTASAEYGGAGYSASEMKAAFDKLPLLLVERYNALLDDLSTDINGSIVHLMQTGIAQGHTIGDMLYDITSGVFAAYLNVGDGKSLASELYEIKEAIRKLGGEI